MHLNFNDIESDKDLSELDKFFANFRLEKDINKKASVDTNTGAIVMQSYPQRHWIEDSKKIGPEMQEKALGFS